MSHANAELIQRFYSAFQKLDAETMAGCYAAVSYTHLTLPTILRV